MKRMKINRKEAVVDPFFKNTIVLKRQYHVSDLIFNTKKRSGERGSKYLKSFKISF